MKKLASITVFVSTLLMLLLSLLFHACKSSDNDPKPGGSEIKITGNTMNSNGRIYVDDEFVFQGTGFSGDSDKDSIDVGVMAYGQWHYFTTMTTTSSTTTSISGKMANGRDVGDAMEAYITSSLYFRIRSGGRKSELYAIPVVRSVFEIFVEYGDANTEIKVGDPIRLHGNYFSDDCHTEIYITSCGPHGVCNPGDYGKCECGKLKLACSPDWTRTISTASSQQSLILFSIPHSTFGLDVVCQGSDDYYYQTKVTVVNDDGKEYSDWVWIWYGTC
ncbi:MAG: hypothetical protein ABIS36_23000 [Chryseolinea sp.]